MTDQGRKVFCIGLDGATFDLMRPWLAERKLPNMARLMREGTWGELESVIQPVSAPAWTSFMTGKNPGKHGIFGFRKQKKGSYSEQFVNRTMVKGKTLWKMLSEQGKRVIVINVPMTYPPEEVDGCIICGMDTPSTESDYTYPAHLKEEINSLTRAKYKIHLHLGGYLTNDRRRAQALEQILNMIDLRTTVADHLLKNNPWDFFMIKFDNPDQVQHYFWKYLNEEESRFKDAILNVYKRLDENIGRLTKHIDENTVLIILSDHGAGPFKEKVVYVNEWLRRQGLLFTTANDQGMGLKSKLKQFGRHLLPKLLDPLYYFSSRIISYDLRDRLGVSFLALKTSIRSFIKFSAIDTTKTKAYLGGNLNAIQINLVDREPNGIVKPGYEYERLRENIIHGLQSMVDPDDGYPIFENIYKKEMVYQGPCIGEAPDLLLVPRDYSYNLSRKLLNDDSRELIAYEVSPKGVTGKHKMNGIFLMMGDSIKKGIEIKNAKLIDVFPTISYLMGLAIPKDTDGRVLTETIDEPCLAEKSIRYSEDVRAEDKVQSQGYSETDAEEIKKRLQCLGYID